MICEPNDAPLDSRHLDMIYALQTLTDKIYMGNVVSGPNAADTIAMTSILFGGRDAIERTPATISLINCNSPLRWDDRMLDAQFEYCAAAQPVVLTPFLLMGAMSPVTIPAALTQQLAEALSGIALAQLIRPGCPVIFGSFLSNIDMQSGSPSFGTPESALGLLCTGQLARHYGLPFRTGGGLNSSQTADAQSAYEALMTLLPTFLAGTNFVMHAAGWLEGGLVSCYEKFIIDIELLRELRVEFTPLEIDEASLAFGAHEEVGHGGHFLGAAAHHGAVPRVLLPPHAVLHGQLRALDQAGRQGHRRPGRRHLAQEAFRVPGAAAGRRHPRRARRLRNPPPPRTRRLAPRPVERIMTISVFDLFKIGIGPSSSHTVGPMSAARMFVRACATTASSRRAAIKAELYGSLGATGKGHGSDKAVLLGLTGAEPDTVDVDAIPGRLASIADSGRIGLLGEHQSTSTKRDLDFNPRKTLPFHANGMRFTA